MKIRIIVYTEETDFNHIRQVAPRVRVAHSYIGMVSQYSA